MSALHVCDRCSYHYASYRMLYLGESKWVCLDEVGCRSRHARRKRDREDARKWKAAR